MTTLVSIPREMKDYVRQHANPADDSSIEKVLAYLKDKGVFQFGCVYLLTSEAGLSFHEANLHVMNSRAWNKAQS